MPGQFPCPNPPVPCETNPNPETSYSAEAQDSTTFIGLAWNGTPPPLNKPFNLVPCEAIAESQVSQADADRIAQNSAVVCASPCTAPFQNTAQTASGQCSDGTFYSLTIPAGLYTAENQVLADRKAFTAAVAALRGHSICLGSLAPASVCRGEFYFGIISLVTTDSPASIVLVSGEVPDGLTLTLESDRAVVQGTPVAFGVATFSLQATSSVGVVTSKTYSVAVTGIVTGGVLAPGTNGVAYSEQLTAIVPEGSLAVWSIISGTLPNGLALDSTTGAISGTPTATGDSTFTVGVTAAGNTCQKQFSIHVASSGPSCIVFQSSPFNIPSVNPDPYLTGSHSATDRRAVASVNSNSLTFINTDTESVIISGVAWNGLGGVMVGELGCFAPTQQHFYLPASDGIAVFTKDGAFVATVAMPGTLVAGSQSNIVYVASQGLIYGTAFDLGTFTRHFYSIDPNTNIATDLTDTGDASSVTIAASPTQLFLCYSGSRVDSYSLPAITFQNSCAANISGGGVVPVYAANSGKLFVSINTFATPVSFIQINPATMVIEKTYVTGTVLGLLQLFTYNPVTGTVVATGGDTTVVVDPMAQSIICEVVTSPDGAGGTIVDYSSGKTFIWDQDFVNNVMNVYL